MTKDYFEQTYPPYPVREWTHMEKQLLLDPFDCGEIIVTLGEQLTKGVVMEKQLPQEEPGSIQWEGGDVNKGDEAGETRDPKRTEVLEDEDLARADQDNPTS
jgi:hypothetical protein